MRNIILIPLCLVCFFFSCKQDETFNPKVSGIELIEPDTEASPGKYYPGKLLFIEGSGLEKVQKVVFVPEDTPDIPGINASFQTTFNSDRLLQITIPWSDEAGSKFGSNTIKITNINGETVESKINIDQPKPSITKTEPSSVEPGSLVTVSGQWFHSYNENLKYKAPSEAGEESVPIVSMTPEFDEFTFRAPLNKLGGEFILTTIAGEVKFIVNYKGAAIESLVSNFDGGGLIPNEAVEGGVNGWGKDGAKSTGPVFNRATEPDPKNGNYVFFSQESTATSPEYSNIFTKLTSDQVAIITGGQKDPSKVTLSFDYYAKAGTKFFAQFSASGGGYQILVADPALPSETDEEKEALKPVEGMWTPYAVTLSEMIGGWGSVAGQMMTDVQKINGIQFNFAVPGPEGNALAIDNIKISAEPLPEDQPYINDITSPEGVDKIRANDIVIIKGTLLNNPIEVYTTADDGTTKVPAEIISKSDTQLILKIIFTSGTSVYGDNKLVIQYENNKNVEVSIVIPEPVSVGAPFQEMLVSDFESDNGGFGAYGSATVDFTKTTDPDPKTAGSKYMYVETNTAGSENFGGAQKIPISLTGDATQIAIQFDYYAATGSDFVIRLNPAYVDSTTPVYGYQPTPTFGAWTTAKIILSDFKQGYQADGSALVDLSEIVQLQFVLNGLPTKVSKVSIDNIKFVPATATIPTPQSPSNGTPFQEMLVSDFESGDGGFEASGKSTIVFDKTADPAPKTAGSKYMFLSIDASSTLGWAAAQNNNITIAGDPTKIAIQFDYYATTDTDFSVRINPAYVDSNSPVYEGPKQTVKGSWTTATIKLGDFRKGYGYNASNDALTDLSTIKQLQFVLNVLDNANNEVAIDNIKFVPVN